MKKLLVLTMLVGLIATGSAEARWVVAPESRQCAAAGHSLIGTANAATDGAVVAGVGWPRQKKRNLWRCTITLDISSDPPLHCVAHAAVGVRSWRFPAALFGCPGEWLYGSTETDPGHTPHDCPDGQWYEITTGECYTP